MSDSIRPAALKALLTAAASLRNPELDAWTSAGGRVIGYYCPFIPEELFLAGGFLPFRMRGTGSTDTDQADAFFDHLNCPFVRHSFDLALRGDYSFLQGLVVGTGCDHLRRIYDNALHAPLEASFVYLLDHPRTMGSEEEGAEPIVRYYREQLSKLKEALENHFGVAVTVPALRAAISLCNETRRLQRRLYDLSVAPAPKVSASERAAVMMAGASMPKERYNALLSEALKELETAPETPGKALARLMIVGPAIEDPAFYEVFEEQGAAIVVDDTCFGARTVQALVDEEAPDPLTALAKYQVVDMPFCPKIGGSHAHRLRFIQEMVARYRVDGVIAQGYVSCDAWGCSYALLREAMQEAGIPYLRVEREYIHSESGQLSTRIQAFLETTGGRG